MRSLQRVMCVAVFSLALLCEPPITSAQEAVVVPSGAARPRPSRSSRSGNPSEAKPADGAKPDEKGKEGEKKPDEKKGEATAPVVKRPNKPTVEPKPEDLKLVETGEDEVRFNFRGAPWLVVLEELARVSNFNLDWQELPGDYLNLVTRRTYSVAEARDVINRHLLTRGYTMILHDRTLSVISLKDMKNINPAVVPEVKPEDLANLMPHEFVRTSFQIDSLIAKELEEQLKPLISPEHGRLNAVESLNRLEAMDTVANLQQIQKLLVAANSDRGQERLIKEFVLEHTRAAETLVQLQDLLGIKRTAADASAMNPQMMQQMQQMMQRVQQQQQKQGGAQAKTPEEIRLIVNTRMNSILATAPPDKMAVIAQAVKSLDVPADPADSLFVNIDRMQTYRLAAVDPETLVKMLEDLGGLEIGTKLEVDKKNKAIIARASLTDHLMIQKLIKKLDGSGRHFEVIKLRRLDAFDVAGSIKFMMGAEEEDDKNNRRSRYSWYSSYYNRSNEEEKEDDKFRVDADVEHNRLLLWANEVELESVEQLLVKLGEIRAPGQNRSKMRLLESVPAEDTDKVLERLRRIWPNVRPNELILPEPLEKPESDEEAEPVDEASPKTAARPQKGPRVTLANLLQDSPETSDATPAPKKTTDDAVAADDRRDEQPESPRPSAAQSQAPPISISRAHDGRLIIRCEDPAALDVLEDLLVDIAPPPKTYKVFFLKHASAFWVSLNLEDFFEEDDKDENRRTGWYDWYYGSRDEEQQETRSLSNRRKLKFIVDEDTNSIMVRGGDSSQWATVEELIKMYDQPSPNSRNKRLVQIFKLRYNNANDVSEAIKDVYRDLLSANDKALQNQQKKQTNIRYADFYSEDDSDELNQGRFKGALSIGVEPKTNTLIVSASEGILQNVAQIVENLERSAQPLETNMQVVKLKPGMDSSSIQEQLSKLLAPPAPKDDKQKRDAERQKQLEQQQQQQNGAAAAVLE